MNIKNDDVEYDDDDDDDDVGDDDDGGDDDDDYDDDVDRNRYLDIFNLIASKWITNNN